MNKITKLLLLMMIFGTIACSSFDSKKVAKQFITKNMLEFYIENDDTVYFYFIINSILPQEINESNLTIEYAKMYFKGQSEDSAQYPTNIVNSIYKESEKNRKITLAYVQKFSKNQLPNDWKNNKIYFVVNTNYGKFTVEKSVEEISPSSIFPEIQALYLLPTLKADADVLNFQLLAIRLNPAQGSYLPSSERMRLEVQNDKIIYNSSEGKNFMQMISEVFPAKIGDYYLYEQIVNIESEKMKYKGGHKAKLIIPAVPINYVSTVDFWNE